MKKYHDLRRKLWNNSSYCFGYPTGDQRREALLSAPGAKEKLLALLDEAERLAADDDILKKRLQDDREWLQRYWIKPNASFLKKQTKFPYFCIIVPVFCGLAPYRTWSIWEEYGSCSDSILWFTEILLLEPHDAMPSSRDSKHKSTQTIIMTPTYINRKRILAWITDADFTILFHIVCGVLLPNFCSGFWWIYHIDGIGDPFYNRL